MRSCVTGGSCPGAGKGLAGRASPDPPRTPGCVAGATNVSPGDLSECAVASSRQETLRAFGQRQISTAAIGVRLSLKCLSLFRTAQAAGLSTTFVQPLSRSSKCL